MWSDVDHRLEVSIEQQAVAMLKFIGYVYAISFMSGIQLNKKFFLTFLVLFLFQN